MQEALVLLRYDDALQQNEHGAVDRTSSNVSTFDSWVRWREVKEISHD